ncbi:MAG: SOS response-associated peptidase [Aristaeellaceae bacterium]
MCGRYYLEVRDPGEDLLAILQTLNRRGVACKTGEIFPTDTVAVIANSRRLQPMPFAMTWGYTLPGGKRLINARSESAAEKPLFREGMLKRRCLIPASHYFEWSHYDKAKMKYAIRPEGAGMMYMAGLYRLEEGRPVFTILTREPAPQIAFIHNRMPVILPRDAAGAWLRLQTPAAEVLAQAAQDVVYGAVT